MTTSARALRLDAPPSTPPLADWLWTFPLSGHDTFLGGLLSGPQRQLTVRAAGCLVDLESVAAQLTGAPCTTREAVIARAFEHWGIETFSRLRGMFAVAVTDPVTREMVVARDHAGLHPVFYAVHGDAVSFASSIRQLLLVPSVSRAFNRRALADALCRRYPDPTETFYASIRRLPGGCFARIANGTVNVRRYWDPIGREQRMTESDARDEFLVLQEQAVRRAMDQGRAAIYLSGGLDSVSVAMIATDIAHSRAAVPPIALSLAFPEAEDSERELQESVATLLGLPQRLVDFETAVGAENLLHQALSLNRHLSSPLLNFWSPPYLTLARVGRASGASIVLTGGGGDEFLSASPYAAADLLRRGRLLAAWRFVREWNRSEIGGRVFTRFGLRPLVGLLAAGVAPDAWDRRRSQRLTAADPAWIAPDRALRREQLARAHASLGVARPRTGFAAEDVESSLQHLSALREKEENFELGRHAGVQFWHPYYDADLVEFLCRAPIRVLNTGGRLKGLVRRQLDARFPTLGFDRQRKLLATGFHRATLDRALRRLEPSALRVPILAQLGVVNGEAVATVMRTQRESGQQPDRLWDLMNLETWLRQRL